MLFEYPSARRRPGSKRCMSVQICVPLTASIDMCEIGHHHSRQCPAGKVQPFSVATTTVDMLEFHKVIQLLVTVLKGAEGYTELYAALHIALRSKPVHAVLGLCTQDAEYRAHNTLDSGPLHEGGVAWSRFQESRCILEHMCMWSTGMWCTGTGAAHTCVAFVLGLCTCS